MFPGGLDCLIWALGEYLCRAMQSLDLRVPMVASNSNWPGFKQEMFFRKVVAL
jgi:hypothetical protein